MKLVFSNCVLYNGAESEVGKTGINLGKEFDRLCVETGIDKYLRQDGSEVKQEVKEEEKTGNDDGFDVENDAHDDQDAVDVKTEVKEEEGGAPGHGDHGDHGGEGYQTMGGVANDHS